VQDCLALCVGFIRIGTFLQQEPGGLQGELTGRVLPAVENPMEGGVPIPCLRVDGGTGTQERFDNTHMVGTVAEGGCESEGGPLVVGGAGLNLTASGNEELAALGAALLCTYVKGLPHLPPIPVVLLRFRPLLQEQLYGKMVLLKGCTMQGGTAVIDVRCLNVKGALRP